MRVQFIVARYAGATPQGDAARLERGISEIVRTWQDRLAQAIAASGGDADALEKLESKYRSAFSAGYAETFAPERALVDIKRIERLDPDRPVAIDFYSEAPGRVHAAMYRFGPPMQLSERVPILENLGFSAIDERTYRITPRYSDGVREVTLHDMALQTISGDAVDLAMHGARLEEAFLAVFQGLADNDGFNRLVMSSGADWREAAILRAYAAYLRQLGSPFGLRYLADTLNRHAGVSRDLLELFHLRLNPDRKAGIKDRDAAEAPIRKRIDGALGAVPSLDEDRILRQFLSLVAATVRTNFYQTGADGRPPETITFKFDGKALDPAPQPRPYREDLGLFAARGGCASALWADGARRHPVVGPGAGFPHRDPGPRACATREERGDRSDRRQGRLPAQADAAQRRARRRAGRGHRRLPHLHFRAARRHRQCQGRRRGRAAARGAPRRR